jgi:hypothetical protein
MPGNGNTNTRNHIYNNVALKNPNITSRNYNDTGNLSNNGSNPVDPTLSNDGNMTPNLKIRIPNSNETNNTLSSPLTEQLYNNANNARNNTSLTNNNLNENANADEIDTAFSNIDDSASSTLRALNAGDKDAAIIHFTNLKKSVRDYDYITKSIIKTKRVKDDREIIKNLYAAIGKAVIDYESRFSDNITHEFMKVEKKLQNYKPRNRNNNYKPYNNSKSRKTRKNRKNKSRKNRK